MLCVHCGVQCCFISSQWKFLPASLGVGLDPFFLCWKSWGSINAVWMQACFPGLPSSSQWRAVVSIWGPWQWSLEHSGQAMVLAVSCRSKQMRIQRGMAGPGSLDRLAKLNLPNSRRKLAAPEEGQSFPYGWSSSKWEQHRVKQGSPTCSLWPAFSQSQWLSHWVI